MEPETVWAAIKADTTGAISAAITRATKDDGMPLEILVEDVIDNAVDKRIPIARATAESLGLPFVDEDELPDESIADPARAYAQDVEIDGAWNAPKLTAGWRRLQDFDVAAIKPGKGKERVSKEDVYTRASKRLLRRFISTVFLRPEALAYGRTGRDVWVAIYRTYNASRPFREQHQGILTDPRTTLLTVLADIPLH